jgi:putative acetyltransferase
MSRVRCRSAGPGDWPAIAAINRRAFGGEDEARLVDRLRRDGDVVAELVADEGGVAIGHILFSRLKSEPAAAAPSLAALAPMAVLPERQRQGLGSALVEAGLSACGRAGIDAILVVGHPGYYPRFGFTAEAAAAIRSPYPGPAFMGLDLTAGTLAAVRAVRYPSAFADL